MKFQRFPSYINIINQHYIQLLPHCLAPGTSEVWTKNDLRGSCVIGGNRSVLDNAVDHHGFEVFLRCMGNHSLGFVREFVFGDLFLGEPCKRFLDSL